MTHAVPLNGTRALEQMHRIASCYRSHLDISALRSNDDKFCCTNWIDATTHLILHTLLHPCMASFIPPLLHPLPHSCMPSIFLILPSSCPPSSPPQLLGSIIPFIRLYPLLVLTTSNFSLLRVPSLGEF